MLLFYPTCFNSKDIEKGPYTDLPPFIDILLGTLYILSHFYTSTSSMSWALFKKKNKEEVWGFPSGSDGKESAHNMGDSGSIPGLGRSPEEGNGYSLQ